MARKPPIEERRIILANDQRRRYGARLVFRVLHALHIGALANVTFFLPDGTYGRIRPRNSRSSEFGVAYELDVEAFPSAAEAEQAGMRAAQALLLTAINLDFGIRLDYTGHEPPTVFDRTVSTGMVMSGEGIGSWPRPCKNGRGCARNRSFRRPAAEANEFEGGKSAQLSFKKAFSG
ncbi:hypothetical protein, partial [Aromatoleum diolicum]